MPRNRVIYNIEGLFVGPAPCTGYHFIDSSGVLNNNPNLATNINLVTNIARVQSVNYSLNLPVTSPLAFGRFGSIKRIRIEPPTVNLNFEYLQHGVLNERRLGLYTNFPVFDEISSGAPFYNNNYQVFLLSGFTYRGDEREQNDLNWPMSYRDKRNIFVAINSGENDLNNQTNVYNPVADNSRTAGVYGFGNCYFNSYKATAGVGELPKVSIGYLAENMAYYLSGSGAPIPAIREDNGSGIKNLVFSIPPMYQGVDMPSVFLPGDITVDINSFGQETGVYAIYGTGMSGNYTTNNPMGFGIDFRDIKVQNYELSFDLNRRDINSFGYKFPIDRKVQFPVLINTSISVLLGDSQSGNLIEALNYNSDYNIGIKMKNPSNFARRYSGIALRYDVLGAKLTSMEFGLSIGTNKTVNLNFVTEFDPEYFKRGLFMSGLLNISGSDLPGDYWITESGDFVTDEVFNNTIIGSRFVTI
jgi:hypothetical protein